MFTIVTSSKQYFIGVDSLWEASDWVDIINKEVFGSPIPGVVCKFTIINYSNRTILFIKTFGLFYCKYSNDVPI